MGFFNEDFYKELDKSYTNEDDDLKTDDDSYEESYDTDEADSYDDNYYGVDLELEVNKKNQSHFKDIMDNAAINYDSYWDINNPVVRVILIILFIIIVVGLIYYIIGWISLLG